MVAENPSLLFCFLKCSSWTAEVVGSFLSLELMIAYITCMATSIMMQSQPFPLHSIISFVSCHKSYPLNQTQFHAILYKAHINPPKTTRPTPATSLFTPARLLSSNSFTTPCTIIFRTLASAFVNISATFGLHSLGVATRLMSLV
jgi:hypothetical protein